ncbi:hypothetical protein NVP1063O_102 [Vibrio phage 1.063.O._10N.261.45.C7]|nr:hypothetical protein NVP1063O_102 [Vibrio phage 1.063.O._10N.261.45.C7]
MTEQNFNKPVIMTSTTAGSSVGIFTNGDDTYVVNVFKMKGRDCYKFAVDGSSTSGITKLCPLECWEDLANWLGAVIIRVEGKWLNKEFGKEYIRPYKDSVKKAKEIKEEKVDE